jgi:hypothetical protein
VTHQRQGADGLRRKLRHYDLPNGCEIALILLADPVSTVIAVCNKRKMDGTNNNALCLLNAALK